MALSAEQLSKAKNEAIAHLEYSINVLAASLGVDVSEIGDSYEHGLPENDVMYRSHEVLRKHVDNLSKLKD
jgi:hypothetical protein